MEWTVLYAEDDANDVTLVQVALARSMPYVRLQVVRDGAQAMAYLNHDGTYSNTDSFPTPHVVLADVKMPRISGMEFLAWFRSQSKFDPLPVLMVSSSMQEVDVLRAYELGANAYLAKPAGFVNLERVICRAVSFFIHLDSATRGSRHRRALPTPHAVHAERRDGGESR